MLIVSFLCPQSYPWKNYKGVLDVQTSCLRGINMVFITNKHGVYEVSCFLLPTFLLSKKIGEKTITKKHLTVLKVLVMLLRVNILGTETFIMFSVKCLEDIRNLSIFVN